MSIIDERGRVAGRVNLVDGALILLVILMIPVAFGAYLLFRDPPARLTAIAPAVINTGGDTEMRIAGENLRPYLRVSFGTVQGPTYSFGSPRSAVVTVPNLPPGRYDVVLYDYAQEVSRLKDALTVLGNRFPQVTISARGVFVNVSPEQMRQLTRGATLPKSTATVASVDGVEPAVTRIRAGSVVLPVPMPGQQSLAATLSVPCDVRAWNDGYQHCFVDNVPLAPDGVLAFGDPTNSMTFLIRELYYPGESNVARVRVQFAPKADLASRLRVGDADVGGRIFAPGAMATLQSFTVRGGAIDAVLSVKVEYGQTGWTYKNRVVKIGAPLLFETERYTMEGIISDVEWPERHQ